MLINVYGSCGHTEKRELNTRSTIGKIEYKELENNAFKVPEKCFACRQSFYSEAIERLTTDQLRAIVRKHKNNIHIRETINEILEDN